MIWAAAAVLVLGFGLWVVVICSTFPRRQDLWTMKEWRAQQQALREAVDGDEPEQAHR